MIIGPAVAAAITVCANSVSAAERRLGHASFAAVPNQEVSDESHSISAARAAALRLCSTKTERPGQPFSGVVQLEQYRACMFELKQIE
jgi:hypothetical protein